MRSPCLLALSLLVACPHVSEADQPVRMLRVRSSSPYGITAAYLAQSMRAQGVAVANVDTVGSFDTLIRLDDRAVQSIGIVQGDVIYHYLHGEHPLFAGARADSEVRAVARLFPEWVRVYVDRPPKPKYFHRLFAQNHSTSRTSFEPLSAVRQVCGGIVGSGHLVTALNIARVFGNQWVMQACGDRARPDQFGRHAGGGPPPVSLEVRSPQHDDGARRRFEIGLSDATARTIASAHPHVYTVVPSEDLERVLISEPFIQHSAVRLHRATVAVDGVLVASRRLDSQTMDALVAAVCCLQRDACGMDTHAGCPESPALAELGRRVAARTRFCDVRDASPVCASRASTVSLAGIVSVFGGRATTSPGSGRFTELPVDEHPALVIRKLDPISWFLARHVAFWVVQLLAIGLIGIAGFVAAAPGVKAMLEARVPPRRIVRHVLSNMSQWIQFVAAFIMFHILVAFAVWISEYHSEALFRDSKFLAGGIAEAGTWLWAFITSGKNDTNFQSPWAHLWIAVLKGGWGLTAMAAGTLIAQRVRGALRMRKLVEHILVIGWNRGGRFVVNELRAEKQLYLVTAFQEACDDDETLHRDAFISAKTIAGALEDGNLEHARAVIVLADADAASAGGEMDVDMWVCKTLREIRQRLAGTPSSRSPYVVAEIIRESNRGLAKMAGADEIVCIGSFGVTLLAQAATKPQLTTLFESVLQTAPDTNEIYFDDVPAELVGKTVAVVREKAQARGRLFIGLVRHDDGKSLVVVNPDNAAPIASRDKLVVIAREPQSRMTR